jgi:hypothetical protein
MPLPGKGLEKPEASGFHDRMRARDRPEKAGVAAKAK